MVLACGSRDPTGRLQVQAHVALREGMKPIEHLARYPVTSEVLYRLHTLSERYVRLHLQPAGRVTRAAREHHEIGRASCRERVEITAVGGHSKENTRTS